MFSEWIRRNGFWILDFLKGSKVRKHLNDIKSIMENIDDINVKKRQSEYLDRILSYSKNNVPYYSEITGLDLKSFPIINKNIIKANCEDLQSREFNNKKTIDLRTSGSTGTPFVVRQDVNKRSRVFAEMMYFWGKAGYKIGMKYVFFRIWTSNNKKSKLLAIARNLVMSDILNLDEKNLNDRNCRFPAERKQ